jgi:hypothetical protein
MKAMGIAPLVATTISANIFHESPDETGFKKIRQFQKYSSD